MKIIRLVRGFSTDTDEKLTDLRSKEETISEKLIGLVRRYGELRMDGKHSQADQVMEQIIALEGKRSGLQLPYTYTKTMAGGLEGHLEILRNKTVSFSMGEQTERVKTPDEIAGDYLHDRILEASATRGLDLDAPDAYRDLANEFGPEIENTKRTWIESTGYFAKEN